MRHMNILSIGFDAFNINNNSALIITKVDTVEEAIEKTQAIDFDAVLVNKHIDAIEIKKLKRFLEFQQPDLVLELATDEIHFQEITEKFLKLFQNQSRNYSITDNAFSQLAIYQNN